MPSTTSPDSGDLFDSGMSQVTERMVFATAGSIYKIGTSCITAKLLLVLAAKTDSDCKITLSGWNMVVVVGPKTVCQLKTSARCCWTTCPNLVHLISRATLDLCHGSLVRVGTRLVILNLPRRYTWIRCFLIVHVNA